MKPKYKIQYYIDGVEKSNIQIWSLAISKGMYKEFKRMKYSISDCVRFLILNNVNIESKTIKNE